MDNNNIKSTSRGLCQPDVGVNLITRSKGLEIFALDASVPLIYSNEMVRLCFEHLHASYGTNAEGMRQINSVQHVLQRHACPARWGLRWRRGETWAHQTDGHCCSPSVALLNGGRDKSQLFSVSLMLRGCLGTDPSFSLTCKVRWCLIRTYYC